MRKLLNQTAAHSEVGPAVKHLCIVQLTRTGDLIQTIQAVQGLKDDVGIFLTIVARENCGSSIKFLLDKFFHRVIFIKYSDIVDKSLNKIQQKIHDLCAYIQEKPIDALINFSYCPASKYLCSLLKARHKLGPFMDVNHNEVIIDKWSQYLCASVLRGDYNVFSLVDLYKMIIGNKNFLVKDFKLNERTNAIVLHPFTSQKRKTWNPKKWIEVIYSLVKKENVSIYLVGGKRDVEEAKNICHSPLIKPFSENLLNCVGIKTISEVYHILEKSKLFIGHDSMIGHLAALSQTPTLTISLGNVRPIETSPYSKNAFVLSPRIKCFPCHQKDPCDNFLCHDEINCQVVLSLVRRIFSDDIFKDLSKFNFSGANFYKSSFSNTGKYRLLKISQQEEEAKEIFNRLYRIAWQCVLADEDEQHALPECSIEVLDRFVMLSQGLQHIFELCDFAQKYIGYILEEVQKDTPHINIIQQYSKKIDDIDRLLTVVSKTSPELTPLINYSIVEKTNLLGSNIIEISESALLSYEQLKTLSSVLYELVQKIISHNELTKESPHQIDRQKMDS